MLHDPARHEALQPIAWSETRARQFIQQIVADTEQHFSPDRYWPLHPRDVDAPEDAEQVSTTLYFGAAGVIWALHYLQSLGAAQLSRSPLVELETLLARNREGLAAWGSSDFASYLMGDTPILLMAHGSQPTPELADRLAALIEGNREHPARELMWGAPGTLLAALFLHARTGEARWAELFRATAATLWSQLLWSQEHGCHYWSQDLYGRQSTYLDAVHGFVATASPLIRGRHLLGAESWQAWEPRITGTVQRTASWIGGSDAVTGDGGGPDATPGAGEPGGAAPAMANWRCELIEPEGRPRKRLMQFCHGAPGFVICLADMPGSALDALLIAAGEATWAAGPLNKGSNLCHGTGGNGYAFLKLYRRTGDPLWLHRARAFAMHGIWQTEAETQAVGRMRYSLWTGDPGFAVYLWDCIRGEAAFPTLDVF